MKPNKESLIAKMLTKAIFQSSSFDKDDLTRLITRELKKLTI